MDVTGSCEKQPGKIILLPLKEMVFYNIQNCSLTEVNVWKLHCCHKKGHKRISTQGQFSTSFDLDFHINAYNFISTVPPG